MIDAPVATRYYAAFTFARDADYVVSLFPENAYEVEARYVGFVDFRSRPAWPRFDLAPLARAMYAMEEEARRTPPRGGLLFWEPLTRTPPPWDVAGLGHGRLRLTDRASDAHGGARIRGGGRREAESPEAFCAHQGVLQRAARRRPGGRGGRTCRGWWTWGTSGVSGGGLRRG